MTSIMPESELLRRAVAWVCEEKETAPQKPLHLLLDEAGMRYNLGPKDQRMLMDFFDRNERPCDILSTGRVD